MVIKWGRNGEFLACSGYPECKNTKEFIARGRRHDRDRARGHHRREVRDLQAPMLVKRGRFGEFLACSRYPDCKTTRPISLGVTCPRPNCGGFLTEKRSRRGKVFFGCSQLLQDQVRLRVVGPADPAEVPAVRRAVPGQAREPRGGGASAASPTAAAMRGPRPRAARRTESHRRARSRRGNEIGDRGHGDAESSTPMILTPIRDTAMFRPT